MKILIAGASAETHQVVARIARSLWSEVTLVQLARGVGAAVPVQPFAASRCDLCVLDVMGLGWSQWFPEHAARVETLLAGRSAILLLPPDCSGGCGWLSAPAFSTRRDRAILRRPISAEGFSNAMRDTGAVSVRWAEAAYQRHLYSNVWMQGRGAAEPAFDRACV